MAAFALYQNDHNKKDTNFHDVLFKYTWVHLNIARTTCLSLKTKQSDQRRST